MGEWKPGAPSLRIFIRKIAYLLAEWRLALDDGGRFLDPLGGEAAEAEWTSGKLFDVTAGLVWRLTGERVDAIGVDHGRTIARGGTLARFGAGLKTTRSLRDD